MELIWADNKYRNYKLYDWLDRNRPDRRIKIEGKPEDAPPGFVVIPKRWVVERTNSSSEATVWLANISLVLHRLAPKSTPDFKSGITVFSRQRF